MTICYWVKVGDDEGDCIYGPYATINAANHMANKYLEHGCKIIQLPSGDIRMIDKMYKGMI